MTGIERIAEPVQRYVDGKYARSLAVAVNNRHRVGGNEEVLFSVANGIYIKIRVGPTRLAGINGHVVELHLGVIMGCACNLPYSGHIVLHLGKRFVPVSFFGEIIGHERHAGTEDISIGIHQKTQLIGHRVRIVQAGGNIPRVVQKHLLGLVERTFNNDGLERQLGLGAMLQFTFQ